MVKSFHCKFLEHLAPFCSVQDDLTATLPESLWFTADHHFEEMVEVAKAYHAQRSLHLIDIFGYSGKVSKAWERQGFRTAQFDVLIGGRSHDLLSKRGFLNLLRFIAQDLFLLFFIGLC